MSKPHEGSLRPLRGAYLALLFIGDNWLLSSAICTLAAFKDSLSSDQRDPIVALLALSTFYSALSLFTCCVSFRDGPELYRGLNVVLRDLFFAGWIRALPLGGVAIWANLQNSQYMTPRCVDGRCGLIQSTVISAYVVAGLGLYMNSASEHNANSRQAILWFFVVLLASGSRLPSILYEQTSEYPWKIGQSTPPVLKGYFVAGFRMFWNEIVIISHSAILVSTIILLRASTREVESAFSPNTGHLVTIAISSALTIVWLLYSSVTPVTEGNSGCLWCLGFVFDTVFLSLDFALGLPIYVNRPAGIGQFDSVLSVLGISCIVGGVILVLMVFTDLLCLPCYLVRNSVKKEDGKKPWLKVAGIIVAFVAAIFVAKQVSNTIKDNRTGRRAERRTHIRHRRQARRKARQERHLQGRLEKVKDGVKGKSHKKEKASKTSLAAAEQKRKKEAEEEEAIEEEESSESSADEHRKSERKKETPLAHAIHAATDAVGITNSDKDDDKGSKKSSKSSKKSSKKKPSSHKSNSSSSSSGSDSSSDSEKKVGFFGRIKRKLTRKKSESKLADVAEGGLLAGMVALVAKGVANQMIGDQVLKMVKNLGDDTEPIDPKKTREEVEPHRPASTWHVQPIAPQRQTIPLVNPSHRTVPIQPAGDIQASQPSKLEASKPSGDPDPIQTSTFNEINVPAKTEPIQP